VLGDPGRVLVEVVHRDVVGGGGHGREFGGGRSGRGRGGGGRQEFREEVLKNETVGKGEGRPEERWASLGVTCRVESLLNGEQQQCWIV
jgi:hypothetical protein